MKLHRNASTCPNSRALIAERVLKEGWSLTQAAEAAGVSVVTARKWAARYAAGDRALEDRSSRPKCMPSSTPAALVDAITTLRRLRMTGAEIAEVLGMALSTVSRWLKRIGLGKRSRLEPPEPPNRYERRRAGELVHVDVKKLGRFGAAGKRMVRGRRASRGFGWEFVHVMVDDHSRLAYVEVLPDERSESAAAFLRRGVSWFKEHGVRVQAVMSDNGSCYRSRLHSRTCYELRRKHIRTKPYRPRTNGKAERFIQTLLREWAYARLYGSSKERLSQLQRWVIHYNFRRPHGSLGHKPPGSRVKNLVGNYN